MLAMSLPAVHHLPTSPTFSPPSVQSGVKRKAPEDGFDDFRRRLEPLFRRPIESRSLQHISSRLQNDFRNACRSSSGCMLPSYCHTLPSGHEHGTYLALDMGGSTLRVALIKFDNDEQRGSSSQAAFLHRCDHEITEAVRELSGRAFFSWMADRVRESLNSHAATLSSPHQTQQTWHLGLAWSFPIDQTSSRDGRLMQMGKGFHATDGLLGESLAGLIEEACHLKDLKVHVAAIVNDSTSSLLSGAYLSASASPIALILGTGLNATALLPVDALQQSKYGQRPSSWHDAAQNVLVNTECSLFGHDIFPLTHWDEELKATHPNPDYQPLEHVTSGRYLGEIVRLVIVDAIRTIGLFGGALPSKFGSYEFSTYTMAAVEGDHSPGFYKSIQHMEREHPLPNEWRYRTTDIAFLRKVCMLVSTRAAAWLAASLHALIAFQSESVRTATGTDEMGKNGLDMSLTIACDGSILDKYPRFRQRVQEQLDALLMVAPTTTSVAASSRPPSKLKPGAQQVKLQMTRESPLIGAAVAAALSLQES